MAKDAKGHGSEKRGGPNGPGARMGGKASDREAARSLAAYAAQQAERGELGSAHSSNGEAHVAGIAAQHGVPTGHLSNFPITLIGDKGHAAAQKATISRLLSRKSVAGAAARSK